MNPYLDEKLAEMRAEEKRRQAEMWRLARQVERTRQRHPGRWACRLLYRLGCALVRFGRWLESYEPSMSAAD